jgi:hypothetical protein
MALINSTLHVIFNNEAVLEFDRSKPLPGQQRSYLDKMDMQMDAGIQLGDDYINEPNILQRSQFVANSLVNSLLKQNYDQAIAMCTYLGKRIPDLKQIKCEGVEGDDGGISIEFVYDRDYETAQQEQTIQFFKPEKPVKH